MKIPWPGANSTSMGASFDPSPGKIWELNKREGEGGTAKALQLRYLRLHGMYGKWWNFNE